MAAATPAATALGANSGAQNPTRATPRAGAERGALRVGLALGAGGARGFAHIGVLKALDQAGIDAGVVACASAGSLVGVFYAAGFTPWQMEEVALKVREIGGREFVDGGLTSPLPVQQARALAVREPTL